MEKTWDTALGNVTLRGAMIDIDGTNLADGIEVIIDNKLVKEVLYQTFGMVEDMTVEEVEHFVEENCDL